MDADPDNEIYADGKIFRAKNGSFNQKWDIGSINFTGHVMDIADIDNDGMMELFRYDGEIHVYDVDLKTEKYSFDPDYYVRLLKTWDYDEDGNVEILTQNGNNANVYCYNATNHQELWSLGPLYGHGASEICIADLDNDGILESVHADGCGVSGVDNLLIYELENFTLEYKDPGNLGWYRALDVGDVDNDQEKEVAVLGSNGYLKIFNATTHELEWFTDTVEFEGSTNIHLMDIDNDNETEIIMGEGYTTGKISIYDGATKELEDSYYFSEENIDPIKNMEIADIDDNGDMEFIISNKKVHVIDPADFSVDYSSTWLTSVSYSTSLMAENIDDDPEMEILFCSEYIFVMDHQLNAIWTSVYDSYTCLDISDLDNDGTVEIIAGTEEGQIHVFDGQTFEIINIYHPIEQKITKLKVEEILEENEGLEFVITSGQHLYFCSRTEVLLKTQAMGKNLGDCDAFYVNDYDNDDVVEIILGSYYSFTEISSDCYSCFDFEVETQVERPSCNPGHDGTITSQVVGGSTPLQFYWQSGETIPNLSNLTPGNYHLMVIDNKGCRQMSDPVVEEGFLSISVDQGNNGCLTNPSGYGTVEILDGYPPYIYDWSSGETTQSASNLESGYYSVNVWDAKNCHTNEEVTIEQDTVGFNLQVSEVYCYGTSTGNAAAIITAGVPPYSWLWSNGSKETQLSDVPAGNYSLTITDSLNCRKSENFVIEQRDQIVLDYFTQADNPNTPEGEGSVQVEVSGGAGGMHYIWDDIPGSHPYRDNLQAGSYNITVIDMFGCSVSETITIQVAYNFFDGITISPNPAVDFILIGLKVHEIQDLRIELKDSNGQCVRAFDYTALNNETLKLSTNTLRNGLYFLAITHQGEQKVWKIILSNENKPED